MCAPFGYYPVYPGIGASSSRARPAVCSLVWPAVSCGSAQPRSPKGNQGLVFAKKCVAQDQYMSYSRGMVILFSKQTAAVTKTDLVDIESLSVCASLAGAEWDCYVKRDLLVGRVGCLPLLADHLTGTLQNRGFSVFVLQ